MQESNSCLMSGHHSIQAIKLNQRTCLKRVTFKFGFILILSVLLVSRTEGAPSPLVLSSNHPHYNLGTHHNHHGNGQHANNLHISRYQHEPESESYERFEPESIDSEGAYLIDFSRLFDHHGSVKREEHSRCHPTIPFQCPLTGGGTAQTCISIQYLCDGAPDCPDGYDEDPRLCTAAKRPPVEETASILQTLLGNHGPNYLEKLFGKKARDALAPLGGVQKVAVALSESETLEDFGAALHLMRSDLEHLRSVLLAVESGDSGLLRALGVRDSELGDVKVFLDKLASTGFMD